LRSKLYFLQKTKFSKFRQCEAFHEFNPLYLKAVCKFNFLFSFHNKRTEDSHKFAGFISYIYIAVPHQVLSLLNILSLLSLSCFSNCGI